MQLSNFRVIVGFLMVGTIYVTYKLFDRKEIPHERYLQRKYVYDKPEDFEGFDNVSGTYDGCYIVPNVVHFVRFDSPVFTFIDAVCVLAAFKNQNPERILFHTNTNFSGKYWGVLSSTKGLKEKIVLVKTDAPRSVFGKRLSKRFKNYHAGDVARLLLLMEYGGIYLDNDSYIVRSLDDFRRYEITLGWKEGGNISNQVIIAHKNARFLREWMGTYDHYVPTSWFYNAGIRPTQEVLLKRPELVHRVTKKLAEYRSIERAVYLSRSNVWKEHYAIHLLINHQREMLKRKPIVYTDVNIKNYDVTLKDMAYAVYPFKGYIYHQPKTKL